MGHWRKQFLVLLVVQLLIMTSHGMFIPLLPSYLFAIQGLSSQQILVWSGVIFAANFILMMLSMPILGKFGDRYGRKPVMLWSGFGMSLVTSLMFFAHEPLDLAILRFVQGCFSGILPFTMVLVVMGSPKENAGVSIGTLQMVGEMGSVLGPLIGGTLLIIWPAKVLFLLMGGLILLATLFVLKFVREPERTMSILPTQKFSEDWKQVWSTKQLPQLVITGFCINFALIGTSPIMPFYVKHSTGSLWNESLSIGIVLAATSFAIILFSPMLGKLSDRIGPLTLLKCATASAALLSIIQMYTHSYLIIFICRFLLGVTVAAMLPNIQMQVRKFMKEGMESRTFMISNSWMFFGGLFGSLLSGQITAIFGVRGWFGIAALVFAISFWQVLRISQVTYTKKPIQEGHAI